jgi:hypothetical protein
MGEILLKICGLMMMIAIELRPVKAISYCSNHTYAYSQGTNYMQFTKETIHQDYAVEGQFKALQCCAKGYRSIEW